MDDKGGVGPQHDQLAMCHVDHSHHPKGNGQSDPGQNQDRAQAQPEIQCFDGIVAIAAVLDRLDTRPGLRRQWAVGGHGSQCIHGLDG